jgi:uncharacterized protein (UPF0332 family)
LEAAERTEYVRYKIEQAREVWEEAECLYAAGKYRGCASRAYFSVYRAVVAALVAGGVQIAARSPRHSQALGQFNRLYVRSGQLPRELGRFLHDLEDLRVRADYRDRPLGRDDVCELMEKGRAYLDLITRFAMELMGTGACEHSEDLGSGST